MNEDFEFELKKVEKIPDNRYNGYSRKIIKQFLDTNEECMEVIMKYKNISDEKLKAKKINCVYSNLRHAINKQKIPIRLARRGSIIYLVNLKLNR